MINYHWLPVECIHLVSDNREVEAYFEFLIWDEYETTSTPLKFMLWSSEKLYVLKPRFSWFISCVVSSQNSYLIYRTERRSYYFLIKLALFPGQILEFGYDLRREQFVSISPPLLHSSEHQVVDFTYFP